MVKISDRVWGGLLAGICGQGDYNNPLTLNAWNYVSANPINRVDPSGQCWAEAQFVRNLPTYDVTCNNLDMAWQIAGNSHVAAGYRLGAGAYFGTELLAHGAAIAGASYACVVSVACAATAAEGAQSAGTILSWKLLADALKGDQDAAAVLMTGNLLGVNPFDGLIPSVSSTGCAFQESLQRAEAATALGGGDASLYISPSAEWDIRVQGRTPEQYEQMGMLTREEYGALVAARQHGEQTGLWGDFEVAGSYSSTPSELYNRRDLAQMSQEEIMTLPENIRWRVEADWEKVHKYPSVPTYSDFEFWTPNREKLPEEFFGYLDQQGLSIPEGIRDWNYLKYHSKPPPGIYFGESGTSRIPSPLANYPASWNNYPASKGP